MRRTARPQLGTIVYVGNFSFPDRDAGGLRVLGIGRALREAGYRVVFVGIEKGGRQEDLQPDGQYAYQGFPYVPRKADARGPFSRIARGLRTYATATSTMTRLRELNLATVEAIVAYQAPSSLLWRLQAFCRRRRIGLVADCVEWYDPWHITGGPLGPFRWDSEMRMRWLNRRVGRLITISSFLEDYYRDRECTVLRVPPLVDADETAEMAARAPRRNDDIMRLVYSGSPGKKDLLRNAIVGLRQVRALGLNVEMHLVGPDRRAVAADLSGDAHLLDELRDAIVFHGRVSHMEAIRLVAQADFSVLLRADERYAHAGFPTKLVESLSVGVPVLANLTGDIGEYVLDCREGIVLDSGSPAAFAAGLHKAFAMPRPQWAAMRANARRTAQRSFDYRHYVSRLREFFIEARFPA